MAKIKIHGKEYPVPEEFTMGELADMEEITGQGYDMGQRGIKGMLAIAFIAARRLDPSVTIEDIRRLKPDELTAEGDDEDELTTELPTVSGENGLRSVAGSGNGSEPTPDEMPDYWNPGLGHWFSLRPLDIAEMTPRQLMECADFLESGETLMANRKIEIEIVGDASKLNKEMTAAQASTGGFMAKFGKAAKIAGGVGLALGAVGVGLSKTVKAAQESEKAQARLDQAMKGAGLSMDKYGSSIQDNIDKTSRLAALDDEELSDSFAKLVRSTGDVTKATEGMNLAADIARSRNISLEAATKTVERALIGNAAAFGKIGVAVVKSSDHLKAAKIEIESWRDSSGKLTEAEEQKAKALMDSAKGLDKQATAAKAFDEAQRKFAGGAKEYGETSAAAQERVGVALENVQEIIGAKVLPVVAKLAEAFLQFLNWAILNWPKFAKAVDDAMDKARAAFEYVRPVVEAWQKVIEALVRTIVALFRGDWSEAWHQFKNVVSAAIGLVIELVELAWTTLKTAATTLGKKAIEGVVAGLTGIGAAAWGLIDNIGEKITDMRDAIIGWGTSIGAKVKQAAIDAIVGIGEGAWGIINNVGSKIAEMGSTIVGWGTSVGSQILEAVPKALVGIGTAAWGVIDNIGSVLSDVSKTIIGWGKDIAGWIKDGVVDGLKGLGQLIVDKFKDAWEWAKSKLPSIPGLTGDAFDPNFNPFIVPPTGHMPPGQSGSLMGALEVMRPFANAAAGYGLTITSGLRPGAITANGTPSDHGIGKALDVAGSAAGMAGFFRSLIGNPSVKQAFYDPLGSIFGGQQSVYREGGHSDHVHVATYDKGGWLMPGLTLARNNTGRPERILGPGQGGGTVLQLHVHGPVYGGRAGLRELGDQLANYIDERDRTRTGGRRLSATPSLT